MTDGPKTKNQIVRSKQRIANERASAKMVERRESVIINFEREKTKNSKWRSKRVNRRSTRRKSVFFGRGGAGKTQHTGK
jgi:hypothetical protein